MANVACLKYEQALADELPPLECQLRTAIACAPVVVTWCLALTTWSTQGRLFWPCAQVIMAAVSIVRLAGGYCLRKFASPMPSEYPPGLAYGNSVALNLAILLMALGMTSSTRLAIASAATRARRLVIGAAQVGPMQAVAMPPPVVST